MTWAEVGIFCYLWTGLFVTESADKHYHKETGNYLPLFACVLSIFLWFPFLIIARMR